MSYSVPMWIAAFAVAMAMAGQEPAVSKCVPLGPSYACFESDNQSDENGVIRADGKVVAVYQDMRIEADWITYDKSTHDLSAGDVIHFTRGEERLDGDRLLMNLETKVGSITNAKGNVDPGFFVTAEQAVRLPDGRYDLVNARTTACDPDCESWFFRSGHIKVVPGHRISATKTIFRFKNVPVFYFPYFFVPTEARKRSSGFLIPSTGSSTTKGRTVSEGFYWAINRSADATITGEYFSKRGSTLGLDFRARPNEDTGVFINTYFVRDRYGQGGRRANILAASTLGGFHGLVEMNVVSSLVFRQVYENGFNQISSPIEQAQAQLYKSTPRADINVAFDRTTIFFQDQPSASLSRLPTVRLGTPTRLISRRIPLYFTFETSLTGYSRQDGVVQTPGPEGRLDLHPSFELPLNSSDVFSFGARFGVRETAYSYALNSATSTPGGLNRAMADAGVWWTGPRLEKAFKGMRHVIEPTVEYRLVTGVDRFRDTIVVDDVDLYANTSEVEYGIVNRLMSDRELLTWRVFQKVFFDRDFGDAFVVGRRNAFAPLTDLTGFSFADMERRFSPVVSSLRAASLHNVSTELLAELDTSRGQVRSLGALASYDRGLFSSSVSYYYSHGTVFELSSHQARGGFRYGNSQKPGFSLNGSFAYDIERRLFQGGATQVGYNGGCYGWSVQFEAFDVGARKESRIRFAFALKNIGAYGTLSPAERIY
ncbi:MAG TPA: LPS assembly protein LptD [Terriglobia bacterium]|nr:LPS assembly protein LptD [Terriglobia bacterium]